MPYINRAKTKTDGTTAVMLRITIDGRKTVMATDSVALQTNGTRRTA